MPASTRCQMALKEFGRIPKSDFLLRYIDLVELRQTVEKQLNKGENVHKFSRVVSFGNNQEFLYGEKLEQEIAEACRRLIKNAIICWNYLYLSQQIAQAESEERQRELVTALRNGSVVTWQHVNLHGGFDFLGRKAPRFGRVGASQNCHAQQALNLGGRFSPTPSLPLHLRNIL